MSHSWKDRPLFVALVLLGIRSRTVAVACKWFCLIMAILAAGLRLWPGLLLVAGFAGYWYSIQWMDKHDAWPR